MYELIEHGKICKSTHITVGPRETGLLILPFERTLRDHTHHTTAKPGFSAEVDAMLMNVAEISTCPERNKYVMFLVDEMHIN